MDLHVEMVYQSSLTSPQVEPEFRVEHNKKVNTMAKASQGMKTGDISDARDSEDEEVEEIRYKTSETRCAETESYQSDKSVSRRGHCQLHRNYNSALEHLSC